MLFTTVLYSTVQYSIKIEKERAFPRRGITTTPYIYPSIEGSRINLSWELVIGGAAAIQAAPARYTPFQYLTPGARPLSVVGWGPQFLACEERY
jgi:hypothetical protein